MEDKKNSVPCQKINILDTTYFIKLKPLDLVNNWKYYTSEFIIKEIRDEKARNFYELNKDFIIVKNPSRENMHFITNFAKKSNDLKPLSVPDISILALSYELIKENNLEEFIRKEPLKIDIVQNSHVINKEKENDTDTVKENKNPIIEENIPDTQITKLDDLDMFPDLTKEPKLNKKKKKKFEEIVEEENLDENSDDELFWEGDGEWIGLDNIDKKLNDKIKIAETKADDSKINVFISSADFTLQNVALKMGLPVLGIDGKIIRRIKNYILKCFSCNKLNFDTSRVFCEECGYNTLMKIGYSIDFQGKVTIYDKEAEARLRGKQYNIPKPSTDKKATVLIMAEDQIPKKMNELNLDKDLDKILDDYENYKDLLNKKEFKNCNTSKNVVWGFPKKNPNVPKKYYSKKDKK